MSESDDTRPGPRPSAQIEPSVVGTQAVFRALSILRSLSGSEQGVTGPEVAAKFGYSIPTAHRLLRALEAEKLLVFNRLTHRYGLGPEIPRLSGAVLNRDGVVPLILASLERLRDLTGETAANHWMLGVEHSCVNELLSPNPVRPPSVLGCTSPLTLGAAGRALLIALDEPTMHELLADPEVVPPRQGMTAFLAELALARERGYAESVNETEDAAASIAAPIVWLNQGVAAIRISGPADRFRDVEMKDAASALLEETDRIRSVLSSR
jgi:DNA-binding IclR family transcriptional regulator